MLDRTTEEAPKQRAAPTPVTQPSPDGGGSSLLTLQRQAGNQAVVAMLAAAGIQAKLLVGAVNDPAEAEADRMADRVLRSLATAPPGLPVAPDAPEEPVGRVRRLLRRSEATEAPGHGFEGGAVDPGVARGIERARGGGSPLDPATRSKMESGFGVDFSGIRIHTGSEAATLSRSLNAEAFTTGSDVFFLGTPQPRVLAHELAHTVQQGAAPVRRFVTPWAFAEMTDQGTFTQKSTAQKRIEEYLTKYYELTGVDTLRPEQYLKPPIEETKYDKALNLLSLMQVTVVAWLDAHSKQAEDGTRTLDKNRAARGKGMLRFEAEVKRETSRITELKTRKAMVGTKKGPAQEAMTDDEVAMSDLAKSSIKQHYQGSLTESFSIATTIVGKLVVNDGDSTDFEIAVTIPIAGPAYAGVTLRFNASKQGAITLNMEAIVTAGAKATGVGDIQAALGGFVKASGKDPNGAVNLIKYGLYRRLRESSAVPREIANKLWGGDTGEAGYEQAEKWSKAVEEQELETDGAFVETGGQAEATAKLGGDSAGGSLAAKYQSGSRYDKQALTESKGGLGEDNSGGLVGRGAQDKIGRGVTNVRYSGALSLGPFKGELIWSMSYRDDGTSTKEVLEAFEIRANARASMPVGDVDSRLVAVVGSFVTTSKGLVAKFHRTAEGEAKQKALADSKTAKGVAKGLAVPTLLLANSSANAAFTASEGLTWTQWAQGISREQAAAAAAKPGGPPTLSKVGLEIGLTFGMDGDTETGLVELRYVSDLSAQLPELLKVQLLKKTRLGGAKWNGSGWAAVL